MSEVLTKETTGISLSVEQYQILQEAYNKLGQFLTAKKPKKKGASVLKTLHGIWKGAKVDEKDFEKAEKSLFKPSL